MRTALLNRSDGLRETLLYQVSDIEWARLLWNPNIRSSILALFTKQNGRHSAHKLAEQVSLQVLYTSLKKIQQELSHSEGLDPHSFASNSDNQPPHTFDPSVIFQTVSVATSVLDSIPVSYRNLSRVLLLVFAHSSLCSLSDINEDDKNELSTLYRTRVDFIRQNFDESDGSGLRNTVIHTIKKVVAKIYAKDKSAADAIILHFAKLYKLNELLHSVTTLLTDVGNQLTPLRYLFRSTKMEFTRNAPDFFSNDEGDNVAKPRDSRHRDETTKNPAALYPAFFSDEEGHVDDGRNGKKRTHRHLRDSSLPTTAIPPGNDHSLEHRPSRSSRKRNDFVEREISLSSSADVSADSDSASVERMQRVITSHFSDCEKLARCKIQFPSPSSNCSDVIRKLGDNPPRKRPRNIGPENSSKHLHRRTSRRQEKHTSRKSPTGDGFELDCSHGGGAEPNGRAVDGNLGHDFSDDDIHVNGNDVIGVTRTGDGGNGGAPEVDADSELNENDTDNDEVFLRSEEKRFGTIKQLRKANRTLKSNPLEDPLKNSLQDADNLSWMAKRRKRRALDQPASGARDASPIPESSSSYLTKRRRPARVDLAQFLNDTDENDENDEDHEDEFKLRSEEYIGGMRVIRGRFSNKEDRWLVEGLEKFGWGSWALIAKNFGDGKTKYTRNGVSLKDRARTLQLNPIDYLLPSGRLENRGRRSNFTPLRLSVNRDDEGEVEEKQAAIEEEAGTEEHAETEEKAATDEQSKDKSTEKDIDEDDA